MISAILFTTIILALVSLTAWIVNRTFKENRKLIEMAREADCERTEAIERKRKYEAILETHCIAPPEAYVIGDSKDHFAVFGRHSNGNVYDQFTLIKSYAFDPSDSESEDFARRNAEELVEILKREVV